MTTDVITEEVIRARIDGIMREMQAAVMRTGFSTIIRESHDFSAGITDKKLIQKAENMLKDADCVIANHSDAMGAKKSKIAIVEKKNVEWIEGSKNILSRKILEKISTEI